MEMFWSLLLVVPMMAVVVGLTWVIIKFLILAPLELLCRGIEALFRAVVGKQPRGKPARYQRGTTKVGLRRHAEIIHTFPDDVVWDEDGENVVSPGTLNICVAIIALMESRGWTATSPDIHSFYGWWFNLSNGGERYWVMTQGADECILQTENESAGARRSPEALAAYGQFLTDLNGAMRGDPRFGKMRWAASIDKIDEDWADQPVQEVA